MIRFKDLREGLRWITLKDFLILVFCVAMFILAISAAIANFYAIFQCGWSGAWLYGKNVFWAWYFGYC